MTIFGFGAVAVVGIGALVLGVILMVVWWAMAPRFFRGETLPMRSADLLLEPAAAAVGQVRAAGLRRGVDGDRAGPVEPAAGRNGGRPGDG